MGGIDGKAEGAIPGLLHPPEDFFRAIQTATDIELKDLWMVRARGEYFQLGWVTELTKFIVPDSATAFATATPPSGVIVCKEPMGAIITGMRSFCPKNVVEVSIFETSTSTRGRNPRLSKPNRLRRIVVSDSAPPVR